MKLFPFAFLLLALIIFTSCSGDGKEKSTWPYADGVLVINEIMAKNKTTIADENNEYDDWIELYNAGSDSINIAGLYISDNLNNLTKNRIPAESPDQTSIAPGGYLIIWFDSQTFQGPLHMSSNLSGDGEDVVITADDGTSIINQYTFETQSTDTSMGRSPDGSDNWIFYSAPTPGISNP